MSTPTTIPGFEAPSSTKRLVYATLAASLLAIVPFLAWTRLTGGVFPTSFLPHLYCYLSNPPVVWTNVAADSLIGIAYLAISITLGIIVRRSWRDIPFPSILLAFGLFIVACGATHFMEVVTIWSPLYVLSTAVKLFTAGVSLTTAIVLPLTVPQIFALVQQAKRSEQVTVQLRASEQRKDSLLQEIHHRVKNNLAVICSLLYLQSNHAKDPETAETLRDMERRVHSMALVHETLYGSENGGRIDFAEYAHALAEDILSSHGGPEIPVRMKMKLERVMLSTDLAVLCGLILNELISNAFKHGFPSGTGGEIKLTLGRQDGKCILLVEDNGVGIPADLNVKTSKSLGMRLVRSLTRQIRGTFELVKIENGTSALLQFPLDDHEP